MLASGGIITTVDAKSRTSVPADIRNPIFHQNENIVGHPADDQTLYIWPSVRGAFLEGGGEALMRSYQRSLDTMDYYDEARVALQYFIIGESRRLSCDKGGRISLPKDFLEHAKLTDSAKFVGLGSQFEVWNPDLHAAHLDSMRATALASLHRLKPVASPPVSSPSVGSV